MKTHTELLNQLIDAVYALPFTTFKEAHDLQMLAAEIKGQMMAQLPPIMTLDTETGKLTPTLDADGWIENTGVNPQCLIIGIKVKDGRFTQEVRYSVPQNSLDLNFSESYITHYKPA
jgi:hypothetical protein